MNDSVIGTPSTEDRFKALFKNLPTPTYIWQKAQNDLILTDYNMAAEEITEGRIKDFLEIKASDMYRDNPEFLKDLSRCANEQVNIIKEMEYTMITTDDRKHFSVKYCNIPPDLVVIHMDDITERKQSEKELLDIKDFHTSILDGIINGIWVTNKDDLIYYTNKGMEKIAGVPANQIVGAHVLNDFSESTLKYFRPYYLKARETLETVFYTAVPVITPVNRQSFQSGWLIPRIKKGKYDGIICIVDDVTERKEMEQKLKESEENLIKIEERTKELKDSEQQYRMILNSINIPLHIVDKDLRLVLINPAFKKWIEELGINTEIFGKKISEAFPIAFDSLLKEYQQVLANGQALQTSESTMVNNVEFFTEATKIPIISEGEVIQIITIIRDITERKEAEQKLKESEEKYRNLYNNAEVGLLQTKVSEGKILASNQKCAEMAGYDNIDQFKKEFIVSEHYVDPSVRTKMIDELKRKGRIENFEAEITDRFGDPHWWSYSAQLYPEKSFLEGVIIDISDKKEAELKLKTSEYDLKERVNELNCLYELSKLFEKSGISTEEKIQKTLELIPPAFQFPDITCVMIKINDKEFHTDNFIETKWNLSINFKINEHVAAIKVFYLIDKLFLREEVDFLVDMGERLKNFLEKREYEKKLEEQNVELGHLNELKSEFLRRASHELKTPLISIKGFAILLLKLHREELSGDAISMLEEIEQGCSRLEDIIISIIESSKLESSKVDLRVSREDLSFLIKFCVKELQGLADTRNHSINLEIIENINTNFNKEQMYEVITNLMSNAIKYTPPGGEVTVKTEIKEQDIIVSIKDTGIGFTEEEKKRIFQQFGKIERYGQGLDIGIDGTGLGLHFSKKIVELHGGKIWMESEGRYKGSTFYFSLPMIKN